MILQNVGRVFSSMKRLECSRAVVSHHRSNSTGKIYVCSLCSVHIPTTVNEFHYIHYTLTTASPPNPLNTIVTTTESATATLSTFGIFHFVPVLYARYQSVSIIPIRFLFYLVFNVQNIFDFITYAIHHIKKQLVFKTKSLILFFRRNNNISAP